MALEPDALTPEQTILVRDDSGAPVAVTAPGAPVGSEGSLVRQIVRVFIDNRLAVVGAAIVVLMVLFCYLGPVFYHTNQTNAQTALLNSTQNSPPNAHNLLGTDDNGFDILGRIMYGGQTSLEIGFAAAAIATVVGVLWGAVSGFFGGVVDAIMMRVVDVFLSLPTIYLLITLTVIFQASEGLLILVIGLTAWLVPARLVRGETLTLRVREYVQAVKVMGGKGSRVVLRHIIPNAIGAIVVNATFQVADAILILAALGYLGLGVPAPKTDWGSMLSNGVGYVTTGYWWEIYPVAIAIVLVVVSLNFIGDALRDALEVRLQQR
ncbi:MAG: Oligopeptide transport system permease protein OppC [Acidimicrobiaceae bacterium]|nr:Oligopeptide transport system permease protein OppC [Acidimicrobiaceae bacterium]